MKYPLLWQKKRILIDYIKNMRGLRKTTKKIQIQHQYFHGICQIRTDCFPLFLYTERPWVIFFLFFVVVSNSQYMPADRYVHRLTLKAVGFYFKLIQMAFFLSSSSSKGGNTHTRHKETHIRYRKNMARSLYTRKQNVHPKSYICPPVLIGVVGNRKESPYSHNTYKKHPK